VARAIILLGEGYEELEAVYPLHRLLAAGIDTIVASDRGGIVQPRLGVALYSVALRNVDSPPDLLLIPGGWAPDRLRDVPAVVEFVRSAASARAVIAATCQGPALLIEAGLVRGKRLTGWQSIATDISNAGGIFVDEGVVVDGLLVTARQPSELPAFGETLVQLMKRRSLLRLGQAAMPVMV